MNNTLTVLQLRNFLDICISQGFKDAPVTSICDDIPCNIVGALIALKITEPNAVLVLEEVPQQE